MPVTTRKRKPAPPPQPSSDDDMPESTLQTPAKNKDSDAFEKAFNINANKDSSSSESESDYVNTRKRKRTGKSTQKKKKIKTKKIGPPTEPDLPEMSDEMDSTDNDQDYVFTPKRYSMGSSQTSLVAARNLSNKPQHETVQIQLQVGNTLKTISLDVSELLRIHNLQTGSGLMLGTAREQEPDKVKKTGFMDLPYELRLRVYRMTFVNESPIQFTKREGFNNRAHFLRVCKKVADEGTEVLYGENSFHILRNDTPRGKWSDRKWPMVGYRDVRRFLETIGTGNISKLKHLSFILEDPYNYRHDTLNADQFRFVNDPVLMRVFNLIGAHTTLTKFHIVFSSRCQVLMTDYWFLRALTSIKCYELYMPHRVLGYTSRVSDYVYDQLKSLMVVKRDDIKGGNASKAAKKQVKMIFDKPNASNFQGHAW